MFPRSNVAITGGEFVHNEFRIETAFEKLQKASAPSAFHDSSVRFDPPKCHPNTRVAILDYLMGWVLGQNDPEALILWLYGPAGAGKSAILQTLAERCFERKVLLASFFFGRFDKTRNHSKPLVATIAYQIAMTIPEVKPFLESIIDRDPLIFNKSIAVQVQSLIVNPLKDLAASGYFNDPNACARLVLIDGLDECSNPHMHELILTALANALRNQKLPLIFLIASRPEQRITLTFNSPSLTGLWRSLVLDDKFKPDNDIRVFLKDSFGKIKTSHPHRNLIPESWPENSDIDKLVEKSSGQFIYASVVVKYISGHGDRPHHRLDVVKGLRPVRRDIPFAELDALYMHILGSCINLETVLLILGIHISKITNDVYTMEVLLDLQPGDVEIALVPLNSLLNVRTFKTRSFGEVTRINPYHASFGDFLVDISRSCQFYINTLAIKENVLCKCIKKLIHPPPVTVDNMEPQHPMSVSLLISLSNSIRPALSNLPPTEAVQHAFEALSLPRMWTAWSPEANPGLANSAFGLNTTYYQLNIVQICLNALSSLIQKHAHHDPMVVKAQRDSLNISEGPVESATSSALNLTDSSPITFPKLYAFHLSSFEPFFRSVIAKYYTDMGLLSLLVLIMLNSSEQRYMAQEEPTETVKVLFRITTEAMAFDTNHFQLIKIGWDKEGLMRTHYRYLFTGPRASPELRIDGNRYAQAALRTLEFLCAYPPYHMPHQHRRRKFDLPYRATQTKRRVDDGFPRKRREEKHRYGATLSPPHTEGSVSFNGKSVNIQPCRYGLMNLPELLEISSKPSELVDFILIHGKEIAYLPKLTREAILSMHEYLDRVGEGKEMDDLRKKFAAMIEENQVAEGVVRLHDGAVREVREGVYNLEDVVGREGDFIFVFDEGAEVDRLVRE